MMGTGKGKMTKGLYEMPSAIQIKRGEGKKLKRSGMEAFLRGRDREHVAKQKNRPPNKPRGSNRTRPCAR